MPPFNPDCPVDESTHSLNVVTKTTKVSFSTVTIRTFNRIVGDHPDCRIGPPISIGWDYLESRPREIDDYEQCRIKRTNLRLTSLTRKNLLQNVFGVPEDEIRNAQKEVQKILKMRGTTNKQGKTGEKAEAIVQSARRRMKRAFSKENIWKGLTVSSKALFPLGSVY